MVKKIFISYSRTNQDHIDRVLKIATILREDHGIDVILDLWDCKEGTDLYVFMESMVADPSIDYVVILSDTLYTKKANNREGGVGTESTIISSEIFDQINNEKYIPVFFNILENGNASLPVFCSTKNAIDMTNAEKDIQKIEELGRRLNNKPLYEKPQLGNIPNYNSDKHSLDLAYKKIENSSKYNEKVVLEKMLDLLLNTVKNYDKNLEYNNIENIKHLSEIFIYWKKLINYLVIKNEFYFRGTLIEHYNKCLKEVEFEEKAPFMKTYLYFSFLILVSKCMDFRNSEFLKDFLYNKYYFQRDYVDFTILSTYPRAFESCYSQPFNLKKKLAEIFFDPQDIIKLEDVDIILYTASLVNDKLVDHSCYKCWHGSLAATQDLFFVTQKNRDLINKFRSKDYYETFIYIFNIELEDLKNYIEPILSKSALPTILNYLNIEEIGVY